MPVADVQLQTIDMKQIGRAMAPFAQSVPDDLSQVGVQETGLLGGQALMNVDTYDNVALERRPQDGNADNPALLLALRDVGVRVKGYDDFRQFEMTITAPRARQVYRDLLGFASSSMEKIGEEHGIDTAPYRKLGDSRPGFRIALITNKSANEVLGFLGYNLEGDRIFVSRDGQQARVWQA